MAKKSMSSGTEQVAALENHNGRMSMGRSAIARVDDVSAKDFSFGLTARKTSKNGSPDNAGSKVNRTGTPVGSGPRFGIRVKMAAGPNPAESSQVQGAGRIVPPATRRTRPNFWGGISDTTGGPR